MVNKTIIIANPSNQGVKSTRAIPKAPKNDDITEAYIDEHYPPQHTIAVPPKSVIIKFAKLDNKFPCFPSLSVTGSINPYSDTIYTSTLKTK